MSTSKVLAINVLSHLSKTYTETCIALFLVYLFIKTWNQQYIWI